MYTTPNSQMRVGRMPLINNNINMMYVATTLAIYHQEIDIEECVLRMCARQWLP